MKISHISKIKLTVVMVVLLTCLFMLFPHTVKAYTVKENKFVYDDANLLTDAQQQALEKSIAKVNDKRNINVVILTVGESQNDNSYGYISNFIQEAVISKKLILRDSTYLYINLVDREVAVDADGIIRSEITNDVCNKIRQSITSDLTEGNYYEACMSYVKQVNKYMGNDQLFYQVWFQLAVAVVISAIIVAIMATNHGSRVSTNANTYLDASKSGLKFHHDNYIRTTVTKRPRPKNNSGGGGGGRSGGGGGGRSHSSGHF